MFQVNNSTNKNKGFTLLEIIIATFVIAVGVLSAYAVVQQIISYISFSKSRLTATYLAQEGIEIVRNIRDTNFLDPAELPWNEGLGQGEWEADYTASDLSPYSGNPLKLPTGGFYNYGSGNPTIFTRKIKITPIDVEPPLGDIDYLEVSVLVEWRDRSVTAQENLYNWGP